MQEAVVGDWYLVVGSDPKPQRLSASAVTKKSTNGLLNRRIEECKKRLLVIGYWFPQKPLRLCAFAVTKNRQTDHSTEGSKNERIEDILGLFAVQQNSVRQASALPHRAIGAHQLNGPT